MQNVYTMTHLKQVYQAQGIL